jgi:hypothetical protein
VKRLVLTARVAREEAGYVASLDQLPLKGTGASVREAQDDLIQAVRAWVETHDGRADLERVLEQAGFPGVAEDTELQLEFVE